MRKITRLVSAVALFLALGAAILQYRRLDNHMPYATPRPTPTVSPSPTPSPSQQEYSNASLGIAFAYPSGFSAVDDPANTAIHVSNAKDEPDGSYPANYQTISVSYDNNAASYENVVAGLKGSKRTEIPVSGGTVRFYTYQNPAYPARTLAMAFFSGKHAFTVNMVWNAYDSSEGEAAREAGEVVLIKGIVPTLIISK